MSHRNPVTFAIIGVVVAVLAISGALAMYILARQHQDFLRPHHLGVRFGVSGSGYDSGLGVLGEIAQ